MYVFKLQSLLLAQRENALDGQKKKRDNLLDEQLSPDTVRINGGLTLR